MSEQAENRSDGQLDRANLARLTKDVVVAYVSKNATAVGDLPDLIALVSTRLQGLADGGEHAEPAPTKPQPAVAVRRSISPDHVVCLVCGKKQKTLKRHLAVAHNLTPTSYRELFDLKADYPMTAPRYAEQRSEMAKRIGLGTKQPARPRSRRKAATPAQ
jgi:predicted transcriptional regulator